MILSYNCISLMYIFHSLHTVGSNKTCLKRASLGLLGSVGQKPEIFSFMHDCTEFAHWNGSLFVIPKATRGEGGASPQVSVVMQAHVSHLVMHGYPRQGRQNLVITIIFLSTRWVTASSIQQPWCPSTAGERRMCDGKPQLDSAVSRRDKPEDWWISATQ